MPTEEQWNMIKSVARLIRQREMERIMRIDPHALDDRTTEDLVIVATHVLQELRRREAVTVIIDDDRVETHYQVFGEPEPRLRIDIGAKK